MILKSKIQNLKSRRGARPRRGVTIVEVLFAILVATIGIFSVIVIFPFASSQAKRARLNDMMAAAGRSAFHDFDTRGMRRPDRWLAWDQNIAGGGAFVPISTKVPRSPLNAVFGESFCIDPRMIAAHTTTAARQTLATTTPTGLPGGACVQSFPYSNPAQSPPPYLSGVAWNPSYMRRITLWDGISPTLRPGGFKWGMSLAQANSIFLIDDDISYQRSDIDKSLPAKQDALLVSTIPLDPNRWLKRDSERKISWIATIVPKLDVSLTPSDEYTLSVVMIYDRPNDLDNLDLEKERAVPGQFQSIGNTAGPVPTGGEIILTSANPTQLKLRSNQWVMVSGTYSGASRFQWYRVTEADAEPELNATTGMYVLNATLIGQDWNSAFADPPLTGPAFTPTGNVGVTIVEGAFAVYEKTIRLEYGSSM